MMVRRVITMRRVYDGKEGYNNEKGMMVRRVRRV